jgi:MoaA/NifB/PqqE/SkfB family radical SAM enzyme
MPSGYTTFITGAGLPRLPLEGSIDLTYRCNNDCRHCWVRVGSDASEKAQELSLEEIRSIVDQARRMGTRQWSISGGEPMLRSDFIDIFDHITRQCRTYSLNTNGTLITPAIAALMKRKGNKMVALYGATAAVHDAVTGNRGSFEAVLRGMRYLQEVGAGFTVQLVPMKTNYHQYPQMVALAQSLSKHYRVGAAWLYLSASRDPKVNQRIQAERLSPAECVALDNPDMAFEPEASAGGARACGDCGGDHHFASCIASGRAFHIDPYGQMSFCSFVKDPALRYDLRRGSFEEGWERFIPSLASRLPVTQEFRDGCGACESRADCRWCGVYGFLEHGRPDAKVDYLCAAAEEARAFKLNWAAQNRRYFRIADITVQVDADVPFTEQSFGVKFKPFAVDGPGEDTVSIRHHFELPDMQGKELGRELYRKAPWAVYENKGSWFYLGISPNKEDLSLHQVAVFNHDHSRVRVYHPDDAIFQRGNAHSLTFFPTDQILLARLLADREGCILHSCGVNLNGKGLLFAGHSEAGKSTMAEMMRGHAEILCDDRIILRRKKGVFNIHGTWCHGTTADVSPASAPLAAILFLEKAPENRLVRIDDPKARVKRLLPLLIKPFVTADWWEKSLSLIAAIAQEVPCYILKCDKSGAVVEVLRQEIDRVR